MKPFNIVLLSAFLLFTACKEQHGEMSPEEINELKNEIITSYEKHIDDLIRLDYDALMPYYINSEEFVLFGDGNYWGGYETGDEIWKSFTADVDTMLSWDLSNHHVYLFSRDAASYLVEFDNVRVEANGDTTKVNGCFSYGMQKIDGDWKVATVHVTHNYTAGPWVKNDNNN